MTKSTKSVRRIDKRSQTVFPPPPLLYHAMSLPSVFHSTCDAVWRLLGTSLTYTTTLNVYTPNHQPSAVRLKIFCYNVILGIYFCRSLNDSLFRTAYLTIFQFHQFDCLEKTTSYRMSVAPWDCFKGFECASKVLKILHAYITTDTFTD